MLRVVVHGVIGNSPEPVVIERLARVGVDIESREFTARNGQADTVTAPEHHGSQLRRDRRRSLHVPALPKDTVESIEND